MKFEKTFKHILAKYDKFGTTQKFLDKHFKNEVKPEEEDKDVEEGDESEDS